MNFGATIAKYLLFFINLVFALGGLAFAGLGAYGIYELKSTQAEVNGVVLYPTAQLIIGLVMFMVAFCGCCGAVKEVRCLLIMYAVVMITLAAVKIYFTVKVLQGSLEHTVMEMVNNTFHDNNDVFPAIEGTFKCCGSTGPDSYPAGSKLGPSCCPTPIHQECPRDSGVYDGCLNVVGGLFKKNGQAISFAAIALIAFEFLATVFALCVTCAIGNEDYYRY